MTEPSDAIDIAFSPYAAPQAGVAEASRVVISPAGEVVYAGFWARVAACIIDLALLGMLALAATFVAGILVNMLLRFARVEFFSTLYMVVNLSVWLVPVLVLLGYFAWFHSSPAQATLGKMTVGIKLVRGNGQRVGFVRAILRALLWVVSVAPLGAGVIVSAVRPQRRSLHDWLCDTRVVDRWAYTAYPLRQRQRVGASTWITLLLCGVVLALLVATVSGQL